MAQCLLLIEGGGSLIHHLMFSMPILLHYCNCYIPQNMPILIHEGEVHVVNDCPTTIFVTLASLLLFLLCDASFFHRSIDTF